MPARRTRRLCLVLPVLLIAAIAGLLTAASTAWALGPDEDPIPNFTHLQEQRDAVETRLAGADAAVNVDPDGSFAIAVDGSDGTTPAGPASRGAYRIPSIESQEYDVVTGELRFSWPGLGVVKFIPLDRGAPRSIFARRTVVSATSVAQDLSEVTLASDEFLEQHLVVDEQHASNKLITWRYQVVLPTGVEAFPTSTGLLLVANGLPLMTVVANVAVDETGAKLPVATSWDADASVITVSYDGRSQSPTGDVAIDPVFKRADIHQVYVVNVCQLPEGHPACEIQGNGFPRQFGRIPGSSSTIATGATPTLGLFAQAKTGTIASGASGGYMYHTIPDTKIVGLAIHGTIDATNTAIQCRGELFNITDGVPDSPLDVTKKWAVYGASLGDANRYRLSTFEFDENGDPAGMLAGGTDYAGVRLVNRSATAETISSNEHARCSMRTATPANGVVDPDTADVFAAYVKDVDKPFVVNPLAPSSNIAGQAQLAPITRGAGGVLSTSVDLHLQKWYRPGAVVKFVVEASDKGSGIDYMQVSRFNQPFASPEPKSPETTIDVCAQDTGNFDTPCPVERHEDYKERTLDGTLNEGPNSVYYRATDFAGNSDGSGEQFFLFDSRAPTAPSPNFGTPDEPTSATAISNLPTYDTTRADALIISWGRASDPGSTDPLPTGSGIAEYTAHVEELRNGVWGPASDQPDVVTGPLADGAPEIDHVDIAGREGIYKIELTATDRAGNVSAPSTRYFRIDETDPLVDLAAPTASDPIGVRDPDDSSATVAARIIDPSIGGGDQQAQAIAALSSAGNNDPIDLVSLQRRSSSGGWTNIHEVRDQRWSTTGASVTFTHFPTSVKLGTALGDGLSELRVYAGDGRKGTSEEYLHEGASGPFKACIDTALHGQAAVVPTSVEAIPIQYVGTSLTGARIRFSVPNSAVGATLKWIVEVQVGGEWAEVAAPLQWGSRTGYTVDDQFPRPRPARYRVSAATQACTHRGDGTIATEADTNGAPLLLEQPERVMPLLGLESRWSYHSLPAGSGTDVNVNASTGNVVVSRPLLQEAGIGLWTNVQLTYNSQQIGDDASLAAHGIAGAHMTLAVGPGGSSAGADAAAAGFRMSDQALLMRDADGTLRVFEPIAHPAGTPWNGEYRPTDGARLVLRNINVAHVNGFGADDNADGVAGAEFKLTRPDGVTYYYSRERATSGVDHSELGRLLAVRDREGHQLTYAYECVAVTPGADGVTRAFHVQSQPDGSWAQVDEAAGPQLTDRCPSTVADVAGIDLGASLRMRLVSVRDDRFTAGNGREIRLNYYGPESDLAGHVRMIRGHDAGGSAKQVYLNYDVVGAEKTIRLSGITFVGRAGGTRSISLGYDAQMDDPGKWFDKHVVLGTVTDFKGNASRVTYGVPDADAGFLFVQPRVTRLENRNDVLRGDQRGITFDYGLAPGAGSGGIYAMRLNGTTLVRDQLDRATSYHWTSADPFASTYGRMNRVNEPGGAFTTIQWDTTGHNEIVGTRRGHAMIQGEPVLIPASGHSRLLSGPIDVATVRFYTSQGADVTHRYDVSASGDIERRPSAPDERMTVYATYQPSSARTVVNRIDRDPASGLPLSVTDDKRWTHALGGRTRGEYGSGADRPRTQLSWRAASVPAVARPIVQDLVSVTTPLRGAHHTDLSVDARTGRVNSVDAPGGSGSRSVQVMSYYPSGLLRSTTDALGWTIAYADYTDDGDPQFVSRRFCAPTGAVSGCGSTLAGWNFALGESQVAAIAPTAFRVTYTADSEVSCIRDLRGDSRDDAARFVAYAYDDFGDVIRETSPWKRGGDDSRVRRVTTTLYDLNGNVRRSDVDGWYELGSEFAASDCGSVPSPHAGTTTLGSDNSPVDAFDYDELDRVVLSRQLSNNNTSDHRVSRTEYDLVGNVVWTSEPNHEAGSAGFDYTVATAYDDRDRPVDVRDGENRHTCTYYDAWDNPVAVTPARWQKRAACPTAPDLSKSTFTTYDNAGTVVSTRAINGKVQFTFTDLEGNAIRSEELGGERTARTEQLHYDLRITTRSFDAAGNVIEEALPIRVACIGASLASCKPGSQQSVIPRVTTRYDQLSRVVSTRTARQNSEAGLSGSKDARYAYDADGRKISETLAREGGAPHVARTTYDPFGNVASTTLPNSGAASLQDNFTTFFAYGDDDAVLTKNDRPHDNLTRWSYNRRGLPVARTEEGTSGKHEWQSHQTFSYYDDGSVQHEPIAAAKFSTNRVYADGTCLRAPGTAPDEPPYLFKVLGDQQFSKSGSTSPKFLSKSWSAGTVRRSGRLRLRKLAFDDGVTRTYDESGLPRSVTGCGSSIEWLRRDGVGAPLQIRNIDGGVTRMRYGSGGELLETRYDDGRARVSRYAGLDDDPFSIDPGAGLEAVASLDRPNLRRRYLQLAYLYTLDGTVDIESRSSSGRYSGVGSHIKSLTPTGFTTFEYDHVGALTQTRVTIAGAHGKSKTSKRRNLLGRGRPTSGPSTHAPRGRAVGQNGMQLMQEDVIRDVAGNPRRVTTTLVRAKVKSGKKARSQTRYYGYDVLDRIDEDHVSALPDRTYRFDAYGRLDQVLIQGTVSQDYRFSNSATRGAMLPRSVLNGTTPATRQLTVMTYGNGRVKNVGNTVAGPKGQLVRTVEYDGSTTSSAVSKITSYSFTHLNQQEQATEQTYEPIRTRQSRHNKARKKTDVKRSVMNYDVLGRRVSTNDETDDLSGGGPAKLNATVSAFTGDAMDPYSEATSDRLQPDHRWIMRANGHIAGELREQSGRYHVGNFQNSTVMTIAGNGTTVTATFDYDTWGEPLTGNVSLESGSDAEQRHNVYSYTGMRESNAGGTTYHHARDYRSDLKSWLQTDQYMDPWSDVALSLDPTTRDRHGYAGGDPVGSVDVDGHRFTDGAGHQYMPTKVGVRHFESHSTGYTCMCSYTRGRNGGYTFGSGSGESKSSDLVGAIKVAWKRGAVSAAAQFSSRRIQAGHDFDNAAGLHRMDGGDFYTSSHRYGIFPAQFVDRQREAYVKAATSSIPANGDWSGSGLGSHFDKHGRDFDAKTKEEYARKANEFFERGIGDGVEGKIDLIENRIRMYEASTNTFGSYTLDGEPITFYRPNPLVHGYPTNSEYWEAEPGTNIEIPRRPPPIP